MVLLSTVSGSWQVCGTGQIEAELKLWVKQKEETAPSNASTHGTEHVELCELRVNLVYIMRSRPTRDIVRPCLKIKKIKKKKEKIRNYTIKG